MNKKTPFRQGLQDGLPICLGYLSVAFAFGIFATDAGLSPWQAVIISMTNVTSAGQLAGVPILVGGLPIAEMILTQCVINLRYSLMSVSLSQKLDNTVRMRDRFLIAFMNTDEVFAVASGNSGLVGRRYLFGLILLPFLGWSAGTFLGAIAGSALPEMLISALGVAIYGMFVAIVIPPAKKNHAVTGVILIAVALSCLLYYVPVLSQISSGFSVIICAVAAGVIMSLIKPVGEEAEHD